MREILITSSVLILAVTGLRFLFRNRISYRLRYALWAPVLLRLLLPVSLPGAPMSIMSGVQNVQQWMASVPGLPAAGGAAAVPAGTDWARVCSAVWYCGMAVMGLWLLGVNLHLARRLRKTRIAVAAPGCPLPVYQTAAVVSPCLFGVFRPAVYLTPRAAESETVREHVLLHELCHYRHRDHIFSALRGLCLAVYWFDPLVWLAALLSRRDSELACDEAVLETLGSRGRLDYGRTLVDMIAPGRGGAGLLRADTAMASGKESIRRRLDSILGKRKVLASAGVLAVLLAVLCGAAALPGEGGRTSRPVRQMTAAVESVKEDDPSLETVYLYITRPRVTLATEEASRAVNGYFDLLAEEAKALAREKDRAGEACTITAAYEVRGATEEFISFQWLVALTTKLESGFPLTVRAATFDLETGGQVTFDMLFSDPAAARARYVEKIRETLAVMEGIYPLKEDWYMLAEDAFSPENFYVAEDGVHVFYDNTVLGTYTDVHFSWQELEEF